MAVQQVGLKAVFDIGDFASSVNGYLSGIQKVLSANSGLSSSSSSLGTSLSAGIGGAIGAGAIAALTQLGGIIRQVGQDVFDTLRFFEQLTFSLETLLAIQGKNSGEFQSVEEGLTKTGQAAQEYLLWLQQLAIFSPFTTEQIAQGNQILQTYRFTAQEAAGLTQILVDYASVAGKSADQINAISSAVGRIRTEGHLLARDAQQLIRAGIPIYDFLHEFTGQTVQDLLDLQEKGILPADTAIEAMVAGLKDFEGGGKRVSGTINGLFSSLEDIRQISGRDLFKGMFEGVRPALQELVTNLSAPEARARAVVLGEEIGKAFSVVVENVRGAASAVGAAISGMSQPLKDGIIIFAAAAIGITAFVGTIGILSVAVATIVNPFTLAIAAVAAFAALYITNFDRIQKVTAGIGTFIGSAISTVTTAFNSLATGVGSALGDASSYIANFASDVTDWGTNIVGALADGITAGVGLITQAITALGDVFTYLMAPGSPPRFLPDLDTWGSDTAQTYLDAWGNADFTALEQMQGTIGGLLKSMAGAGKISEISVPQILAGARKSYAEAIDQIVKSGKLSEEALNKAKNAAGPASNEVGQMLEAFLKYRVATEAVNSAQDKLNVVTQKYKDLITPIRAEMERVQELRTKLSEDNEIRNLQRLLSRGGVQESLRQEAMARIEEIRTGQKLRGLEKEQSAALDVGNAELEANKKAQDANQKLMDEVQKRIGVETESHNLLADELRIREQLAKEAERLRKEQERLAKEAEKLRKEQLEKQLKIAQLFLAETKDTVDVFKQQYILASATSTEMEKQNATLELQAVLGRRIVRDDQAKELGVPAAELERLRKVPVTLEDAGIKVKAAVAEIGASIDNLNAIDISGPFDEMQIAIDNVRIKFDEARASLDLFIGRVDAALPSFLKLKGEGEQTAPILNTLGSAFAGLGAGFLTARIISIIGGIGTAIATLNPITGTIIGVVSILAAAYAGNWFGIREATASGVAWLQQKFGELVASSFWGDLLAQIEGIGQSISDFFLNGGLTNIIKNNSVLSAISDFITITLIPAIASLGPILQSFGEILGKVFAPLSQGISLGSIGQVFSNLGTLISAGLERVPGIIFDVFTTITTFVSTNAPLMFQAFLDFLPTIPIRVLTGLMETYATVVNWLSTFVPKIAAQALDLGTAFLVWVGPLLGQAIVGLGKMLGGLLRWIIGTAVPFLFKASIWLGQSFLGFIQWAIVNFPPMILSFLSKFVAWMFAEGIPALLIAASHMAQALLTFITRSSDEAGPSLSKFLETIQSFFSTYIAPALYTAALEIGNGVLLGLYDAFGKDNVDGVLQFVLDAFTTVVDFFTVLGNWIGVGVKLIQGIWTVITGIFADVMGWVSMVFSFFVDFGRAIDNLWSGIIAAVIGAISGFISGAVHMVSDWSTAAAQALIFVMNLFAPAIQGALDVFNAVVGYYNQIKLFIDGILLWLGTIPAAFISQSAVLISTIVTEATTWLTSLTSFITTWGGAIVTTITDFTQMVWDAAVALGGNIIEGIKSGITSLVSGPQEALKGALQSLLGIGQDEIEAHSPSGLFDREIGQSIPAGIAQGVSNYDIAPAFRGLVTKAIGIFKNLGKGTGDETANLTDEGNTMFTDFSTNVVDTFKLMTDGVVTSITGFSETMIVMIDALLLRLLTDIQAFSMATSNEQRLLQDAMVASLVAFGVIFGTSMDGVVKAAVTSFAALRPAIVAEVGLMGTDIITLLNTPDTGFAAQMALAFSISGQGIGMALSDGIVAGFVANEAKMILGLEESLARVLANISTKMTTGGDMGTTSVTSAGGLYNSGPANFLPGNVSNISRETHYHLNVRSEAASQGVVQDYGIMQTMNFDG